MEEGQAGVVCKKEVHMQWGNRKYKCKYMIIWFLNIRSIWKRNQLKRNRKGRQDKWQTLSIVLRKHYV